MSDAQFLAWLEREDSVCKEGRLARLRWLSLLYPDTSIAFFPGGWIAKYLFEESRYCFIYGQFMASIELGIAYVEHTLAALFYAAGRSDLERASISTLLREAVGLNWIDQEQFEKLERARALRNAIAHFRCPLDEEGVEYRMVTDEEMPHSIIEKDARLVMQVVLPLLSRKSPF